MNAVSLSISGMKLETSLAFDRQSIREKIDDIAASVSKAPVNANVKSFNFNTLKFSFSNDVSGRSLDADLLYGQIINALESGETAVNISAETTVVLPAVTKAELMNNLVRISTYTTNTTKNSNRNTNIRLSAEAINGVVVQPGDTFSFNQATGERTARKGYKEAAAISGGQTNDEVGGGVCQTSSTLFNAVARANL